jgi:hypothetical protein
MDEIDAFEPLETGGLIKVQAIRLNKYVSPPYDVWLGVVALVVERLKSHRIIANHAVH